MLSNQTRKYVINFYNIGYSLCQQVLQPSQITLRKVNIFQFENVHIRSERSLQALVGPFQLVRGLRKFIGQKSISFYQEGCFYSIRRGPTQSGPFHGKFQPQCQSSCCNAACGKALFSEKLLVTTEFTRQFKDIQSGYLKILKLQFYFSVIWESCIFPFMLITMGIQICKKISLHCWGITPDYMLRKISLTIIFNDIIPICNVNLERCDVNML